MVTSAHRRVTDRIRPWRAPTPPVGAPEVAVIGAGASGLATAALLRRAGVRAIVFDHADAVGGSWPTRYESLRLNTVRWMSDLPGRRMPRRLGRWVRRDDLTGYLRTYSEHHALETVLGPPGTVTAIERANGGRAGWSVEVGGERRWFDGLVVATGHSLRPVVPDWPGRERFDGRVLHSGEYRRPADHAGRRVLVVGAGSSGGEICVDLAHAGADVTWSVRTAPQVFPREIRSVPATPFAPALDTLPDPALDRIGPWLERRIYGRRDYLPPPTAPMMELLERCKEPLTADGIVALIRNRRVRVVTAVADLDAGGARLVDGSHVDTDDVIAATGYSTGLEPLVGHLGVLDADGRPTARTFDGTLGFVGFRIPFTGTLWAIEQDARHVADMITSTVTSTSDSDGCAPRDSNPEPMG